MKRILGTVALAVLTACSPALNWRQVTLADAGLVASLPCQPDQAERTIELAEHPHPCTCWAVRPRAPRLPWPAPD